MINVNVIKDLEILIAKLARNNYVMYSLRLNCNENYQDVTEYLEEQKQQKEAFKYKLFKYIDQKGFHSDAEFYKKAGLDKQHFSKIRNNDNLIPKRQTVLAIALALELDLKAAEELLQTVGYAFNYSDERDIIAKYCIEKRIYNLFDVNEILDYFGKEPLT